MSVNLLPNSGFENVVSGGLRSQVPFWRHGTLLSSTTNGFDNIVEGKDDNARSGLRSLRMFRKGSEALNCWAAQLNGKELMFPVSPGSIINFGCWAKRVSGDAELACVLKLYDANKANPTEVFASKVSSASYSESQGQHTVAAGKAFVIFMLRMANGTADSEFRVDDTRMRFELHQLRIETPGASALEVALQLSSPGTVVSGGPQLQFFHRGDQSSPVIRAEIIGQSQTGLPGLMNLRVADSSGVLQTAAQLLLPADGETALLVRRNVGGTQTVQRVSMGATDSGGSGFKLLRVPN